MEETTPQSQAEALARALMGKIEDCVQTLDVVMVTRKTKTVEKEDGMTREETREFPEAVPTGVIDYRALKGLTSVLKELKDLLPQQTQEKTIRVIFQGGEEAWRS